MDRHDDLGATQCRFCGKDVPEDPRAANWSKVPRYDRKKYKGRKYVWRCPQCLNMSKKEFLNWLYPGDPNPQNTFGRKG